MHKSSRARARRKASGTILDHLYYVLYVLLFCRMFLCRHLWWTNTDWKIIFGTQFIEICAMSDSNIYSFCQSFFDCNGMAFKFQNHNCTQKHIYLVEKMGFDLNVSMDSSVIRTLTSLNSLQAIDWSASYALEHPGNLECTDEEMSALPPPPAWTMNVCIAHYRFVVRVRLVKQTHLCAITYPVSAINILIWLSHPLLLVNYPQWLDKRVHKTQYTTNITHPISLVLL